MKKFLSVILSAVILMLCIAPCAFSISINEGTPMLDSQFKDGECPNGVDYVYFSPVKKNDTVKYPLLIWLHGTKSGQTRRAQLQWYEISNWASDEYQEKFQDAGGCFIFAPRASKSLSNSWDSTQLFYLKDAIDAFVKKYETNIDTERIYIAGYSTGGVMVWDMLNAFPNYFAAALPASAISQPAASTISKLKHVSVWMFCCDKDPYILGRTDSALTTFMSLGDITKRPKGVRMTSMTEAVFADYSKKTEWASGEARLTSDAEHYTWEAITYDMHMTDGTVYAYSKTIDASGSTIDLSDGSGVISWLSAQKRPDPASLLEDDEDDVSGGFDFNAFIKIILTKIATFFENLLGIRIINRK